MSDGTPIQCTALQEKPRTLIDFLNEVTLKLDQVELLLLQVQSNPCYLPECRWATSRDKSRSAVVEYMTKRDHSELVQQVSISVPSFPYCSGEKLPVNSLADVLAITSKFRQMVLEEASHCNDNDITRAQIGAPLLAQANYMHEKAKQLASKAAGHSMKEAISSNMTAALESLRLAIAAGLQYSMQWSFEPTPTKWQKQPGWLLSADGATAKLIADGEVFIISSEVVSSGVNRWSGKVPKDCKVGVAPLVNGIPCTSKACLFQITKEAEFHATLNLCTPKASLHLKVDYSAEVQMAVDEQMQQWCFVVGATAKDAATTICSFHVTLD